MSRLTKSLLLLPLAVLVSVSSAAAQYKNSPACCVRVPVLKHRWDNLKQLKPDSMSQNQIDWCQKDSTVIDPQDPPVANVKADERDPEDVKYEHELWKRLQGKHWRAETDPSTWPKFLRATTTNSYPERKNLWQVESIYTIRDNDSCKGLASETVSTYGGALERAYVTADEPICYFFVKVGPISAELMSHDKRIRRVREVDDNFPPPARLTRSLFALLPLPFEPQSKSGEKSK